MKWKISNTLFVVAGLIFILGIAFNYAQVKRSVESSLEKARRVKREKAQARKKAEKDIEEDQFFAENDIDTEFEEIINNKQTDGK
tara:strand:+ start:2121 stop:2375 length:255 start_codon:yes stop_codon:yes gene_type:complete